MVVDILVEFLNVAQVDNLPYRRLAVGRSSGESNASGVFGTFAGYQPAIRQSNTLRYESDQGCGPVEIETGTAAMSIDTIFLAR